MVVAHRVTPELNLECDLLVALGLDEPEYSRMGLTAIPAQLLGFAVGLRKTAESGQAEKREARRRAQQR